MVLEPASPHVPEAALWAFPSRMALIWATVFPLGRSLLKLCP